MFGKTGKIAVDDVLGYDRPGGLALLVDVDGSESGGCNVLDEVQANYWAVCDAKKSWAMCGSCHSSHCDTRVRRRRLCRRHLQMLGLFLLLQAAEMSREWQREIAVVQLDIKHRAAFKAMKLQGVSMFPMALIAAIWNGSCMKARLVTVLSSKVRMSRGLPQGAPESPVIVTLIVETGAARSDTELDNTKTGVETGRLCAGCDLLCGRCGVGCCVSRCCGSDGDRGYCKVERGRSDCWCAENMVDELPEDGGQKHHGGRTGCVVGGSPGVCGIEGVCVETCSEIFMASPNAAFEHCKNFNVAGISLELERLDDGQGPKRQTCELECENGGKRDWSEKPPGMEMDQWWRLWERTGHRWIEKSNMNVLTAIRERLLSWAGHVARTDYKEICAKALRCRGLQWWRWRQCYWKEMEKDTRSGPHPQRFKIFRWEDMVAGEVSKFTGNADGFSESVQESTGGCILPCFDGPRCLRDHCASGMTGTGAGAACMRWSRMVPPDTEYRSRPQFWMTGRETERVRFGVHLLPLSVSSQFWWYSDGYGWRMMACRENGRRSGSWS